MFDTPDLTKLPEMSCDFQIETQILLAPFCAMRGGCIDQPQLSSLCLSPPPQGELLLPHDASCQSLVVFQLFDICNVYSTWSVGMFTAEKMGTAVQVRGHGLCSAHSYQT